MKKLHLAILLLGFLLLTACARSDFKIENALLQAAKTVEVKYTGTLNADFEKTLMIEPAMKIVSVTVENDFVSIKTAEKFLLDQHYFLILKNGEKIFIRPDGVLDELYSEKPMGYTYEKDQLAFRVFAPRAKWVKLVMYEKHEANSGKEVKMLKDKDGVWEYFFKGKIKYNFYGYKVWGPQGNGEVFDSTVVVADPYSPATVSQNHFTHPAKTLIFPQKDKFNWGRDKFSTIDHRDLIIYEMHVRDLTAHPSSGAPVHLKGTYPGLVYKKQKGGLPYIKKLGVNAVELLPAQDFGNIEITYKDSSEWIYNNWNPYERNHWGYMTSYFFAPESYYATGGTMERGKYNGADGHQVSEFKNMVKTFHQNGISVLMDVVYNHVSQYDNNSFKFIDKFYYFRVNDDCSYAAVSGCGNDFKTERPMARKMIVESVKHWIKEYHVDGFRFDLAKLIDWQTCDEIIKEARKINPNVVIIAEPWGGGYDPDGFSDHGWAAWNDKIRNGVKGQNPNDGKGFIFGQWQGDNSLRTMQRLIMGSLRKFGGQYNKISHSINYLESHDDHTMGDFIRIATGLDEHALVKDIDKNVKLSEEQMKLHKLAALTLLTSQGPVMIHEGQEYARSKVIAEVDIPDGKFGHVDHNSYEKDDATNYLNYKHAEINKELFNYYSKLITLRKTHDAFRQASPEDFTFMQTTDSFLVAYELKHKNKNYVVVLNGSPKTQKLELPKGNWQKLADGKDVYPKKTDTSKGKIEIPATSGLVLKRK